MDITNSEDVRWLQRYSNYQNALSQLGDAVRLSQEKKLSPLEKQGLVKVFEFTYELAWNVLKDYFEYQGNPDIKGSRDAIMEAFKRGLIVEGETWMDMIKSRNRSSHTYAEEIANMIIESIVSHYYALFLALQSQLEILKNK